jgi:hypothetical protein
VQVVGIRGNVQKSTRIGEVHVANVSGVSDTFWFRDENDQTVTVGVSGSPAKGYTVDGSVTLTDSLSADGSEQFGKAADVYVYDDALYQRYRIYIDYYRAGCRPSAYPPYYAMEAVDTEGDVYQGSGHPGSGPWKSCRQDPYDVTLQSKATWSDDHSQAVTYTVAATIFDFNFSVSDGFTQDIEDDYAGGSQTTYICGVPKGKPTKDGDILYNTR